MEWVMMAVLLAPAWAAYTEEDGAVFMVEISNKSQHLASILAHKQWDYDISLTDKAAAEQTIAQENCDKYQEKIYPEIIKYPWKTFKDPLLRRQFEWFSQPELATKDRERLTNIRMKMIDIYSKAKVKVYESKNNTPSLNIDDIAEKLATSNDPCEMSYYWDGWHTTVGKGVKDLFQEYVQLVNKQAVLNNFTNNAAKWISIYETDHFEKEMAKLMKKIRPLFQQLHAYMRRKLWLHYNKDSSIIDPKGPIPASLLGDLWGLDGRNIYTKTVPFPEKPSLDVTDQLVKQKYTGLKMAKTAEKFYKSINMSAMTEKFWKYSIFKRPSNVDIDCTPVAYTFYEGGDYRIKICTSKTLDQFGRVHFEMGHIENYMEWAHLPWAFQDAPNPGFAEAIGDMVYLFVVNPTYLKRLGLLDSNFELDDEQEINALYQQALAIVFFLPYAYSLDLWRWRVFQGKIKPDDYNCPYWKIRLREQGVAPPVFRDSTDFDPGAKYHVISDDQYIMYFVSGILEFQLHKSLCIAAGQFDPNHPTSKRLYSCDIFGSSAAGNKLKDMMALGRSCVWQDALEVATGQRALDPQAILDYFQPLYEWLVKENSKTNEYIGWKSKHTCLKKEKLPKNSSNNSCHYS